MGLRDYQPTWAAMRKFTSERSGDNYDEVWVLQHPPVYTHGLNSDPNHLLYDTDIPVVKTDRGGQITYHGPGQLIIYTLLDLRRNNLDIRTLVNSLENATISTLGQYGVAAKNKKDAPGVYVDEKKIASVGLKIRKGCCYHGLSINVAMDLSPFSRINPCGYAGLEVCQLSDYCPPVREIEVAVPIIGHLARLLCYDVVTTE